MVRQGLGSATRPLPDQLLRGSEQQPKTGTPRPSPEESLESGEGRVLACARCRRRVTTGAARLEMSGGHEHRFVNPHGIEFRIGCFAWAELHAVGAPTTYWTWFPGFAWQVEVCAECGAHVGWRFTSSDGAFHGLILDRLVEIEEE